MVFFLYPNYIFSTVYIFISKKISFCRLVFLPKKDIPFYSPIGECTAQRQGKKFNFFFFLPISSKANYSP